MKVQQHAGAAHHERGATEAVMRTAEKIRLEFLCQNCFSEDAYATPENTVEKITTLISRHDELNDALGQGALLDDLLKEESHAAG
jgi:V/A-type H+-transporting ATPase subunit A